MNQNLTLEQKMTALTEIASAVFGCKSSFIIVNVARRQAETVTPLKQYTAEVIIDGSYIADFDGPSVDAALELTARDLVKRVNKIVARLDEKSAKPVNDALALLGV